MSDDSTTTPEPAKAKTPSKKKPVTETSVKASDRADASVTIKSRSKNFLVCQGGPGVLPIAAGMTVTLTPDEFAEWERDLRSFERNGHLRITGAPAKG